jgi:hypothetical protein
VSKKAPGRAKWKGGDPIVVGQSFLLFFQVSVSSHISVTSSSAQSYMPDMSKEEGNTACEV